MIPHISTHPLMQETNERISTLLKELQDVEDRITIAVTLPQKRKENVEKAAAVLAGGGEFIPESDAQVTSLGEDLFRRDALEKAIADLSKSVQPEGAIFRRVQKEILTSQVSRNQANLKNTREALQSLVKCMHVDHAHRQELDQAGVPIESPIGYCGYFQADYHVLGGWLAFLNSNIS